MSRTCKRLLALALLTAACVEPQQYGGPIPIEQRGLTARLETVCGGSQETVCAALDEVRDAGGAGDEADADK